VAAVAGVSMAGAVDFTVGSAASTAVGSTGIDFAMAGSTTVNFATTGFSSVDRSDIPGLIIPTMGITVTANPTRRRLGTTVPILPAITLM
jgi:hypothetical protein